MFIEISPHSERLIRQQGGGGQANNSMSLALDELTTWFANSSLATSHASLVQNNLALMPLRTSLLTDLNCALFSSITGTTITPLAPYFKKKKTYLKWAGFALAGLLFVACEGFDSAVTILTIFSIAPLIILAAALAFSLLSIMIFSLFDLAKISKNFGIKLRDAQQSLDLALEQLATIEKIMVKINHQDFNQFTPEALRQTQALLALLSQQQLQLNAVHGLCGKISQRHSLRFLHYLLASLGALLLFGGGFCSGQTVALFLITLLITPVTPASIPVLAFSLFVGLAAFSWYWGMEFPGVKKIINAWFGVDEKKMLKLGVEKIQQEEELNKLQEKVAAHQQTKKTGVYTVQNIYTFMPRVATSQHHASSLIPPFVSSVITP